VSRSPTESRVAEGQDKGSFVLSPAERRHDESLGRVGGIKLPRKVLTSSLE
jgi:hypothetical protein